jgi:hypothetical protein
MLTGCTVVLYRYPHYGDKRPLWKANGPFMLATGYPHDDISCQDVISNVVRNLANASETAQDCSPCFGMTEAKRYGSAVAGLLDASK